MPKAEPCTREELLKFLAQYMSQRPMMPLREKYAFREIDKLLRQDGQLLQKKSLPEKSQPKNSEE